MDLMRQSILLSCMYYVCFKDTGMGGVNDCRLIGLSGRSFTLLSAFLLIGHHRPCSFPHGIFFLDKQPIGDTIDSSDVRPDVVDSSDIRPDVVKNIGFSVTTIFLLLLLKSKSLHNILRKLRLLLENATRLLLLVDPSSTDHRSLFAKAPMLLFLFWSGLHTNPGYLILSLLLLLLLLLVRLWS